MSDPKLGQRRLVLVRGIFCNGTRRDAIPEVLPQKEVSWNGIREPFSRVINITNTFPSPTEFWVTMRPGTYFIQKNSTGVSYTSAR
jgi:hypothetical protein